MALVIEDGSVVAGANSYTTIAEFAAYLDARGSFLEGNNGNDEQLLLLAMDYLESQDFIGDKYSKTQPLQWPRTGVCIDGFSIDEDEIPEILKSAQIEVAIAIDSGNNPLSALDRETKREKVGDIEVEYSDGARDSIELRAVNSILKKLVASGAGNSVVQLMRA